MQQIPLGVRIPDRAVFESFFPGRNAQAVEYAMGIAARSGGVGEAVAGRSGGAGGGFGTRSVTWLCGPSSVGKTHLLQSIVARASQRGRTGYFPLIELAPLGVGVLDGLTSLDCLCLDDLDQVVGRLDWEKTLFGLLREIQERDGNLVVSATAPPALLPWSLPDLGSRFAAAAIFQLHELDEGEQQKALQLHAHVRGFELPDDTARWLQRRFPRDMRTLYGLLDTLDEAALVAQRRLTVPFIRSVLKE
ncbi:MAG: DnaA regulatory inactivator Hda [Proteobacteria bacterium]|nr:DnaA regulatory inactivator Hda [Pseudomonadota bacterium]